MRCGTQGVSQRGLFYMGSTPKVSNSAQLFSYRNRSKIWYFKSNINRWLVISQIFPISIADSTQRTFHSTRFQEKSQIIPNYNRDLFSSILGSISVYYVEESLFNMVTKNRTHLIFTGFTGFLWVLLGFYILNRNVLVPENKLKLSK